MIIEKLKTFNKIRFISQKVENPIFKKEYQGIMRPLLEEFKKYGKEADNSIVIADELKKFIKAMYQKAITFQYTPFQRNKRTENNEIFKDHNKLYKLESLCKDLINDKNQYNQ